MAYWEHKQHAGARHTAYAAIAEGSCLSIEISWPDRYLGEQQAWVLPHGQAVSYTCPIPEIRTCSRVVRRGREYPGCREVGRLIEAENSAREDSAGCSKEGSPRNIEQLRLRTEAASETSNSGNGLIIPEPGFWSRDSGAGICISGWSAYRDSTGISVSSCRPIQSCLSLNFR